MTNIRRWLLVLFVSFLGGCVNPYTEFYQGDSSAASRPEYIPRNGAIQIYSSDNFDKDVEQLARRGYIVVGSSAFNGATGSVTQQQLMTQAEKVGAHIVLVSSRNTGVISGAVPITVPTTTTSQTSGTATVYGSGGSATAYGRATTTTYGQQTTMMPYTIQRADFTAIYLIRQRFVFGAFWLPLDDQTMKRLQTNQALRIAAVVEESPAFRADILPNDIVTHIDGNQVRGAEWFQNYISSKAGSQIALVLDRDGVRIEKTVTLNAR